MKKFLRGLALILICSALAAGAAGCNGGNLQQGESGGNTGDTEQGENNGNTGDTEQGESGGNAGDTEQGEGGGNTDGNNNNEQGENNGNTDENKPLTYNEQMEKYFGGIERTEFVDRVISLPQYVNSGEAVSGAKYASAAAGNEGDGSRRNPYSLQDGLDSLKAGDTLYLLGGTYDAAKADGFSCPVRGARKLTLQSAIIPGKAL